MLMMILELKKLLKSKFVIVNLLVLLIISTIFAILVIGFVRVTYFQSGEVVTLRGINAVNYIKSKQTPIVLSENLLQKLYADYQTVFAQYGAEFPDEIYYSKIYPYNKIYGIVQFDYVDPRTGIYPTKDSITPQMAYNYYAQRQKLLDTLISQDLSDNISALKQHINMETQVEKPFVFTLDNGWRNGLDYFSFIVFFAAFSAIAVASSVFSLEYSTESDQILRSTKNGRTRLGTVKVCATLLVSCIQFILSAVIFLFILLFVLGKGALYNSFQIFASTMCSVPFSTGDALLTMLLSGFISFISIISFALFISANSKTPLVAFLICAFVAILPTVSSIIPFDNNFYNWLIAILPSYGIGFGGGILSELIGLKYLNIGNIAIWSPIIMLLSPFIQSIIYCISSVVSYSKHKYT